MKKHICPSGCDSTFYAVAHVIQEWEVDGFGKFIRVNDDCLEVTHEPQEGNIWTCSECGDEAVVVD